jgi:hypothetical protein
MTFEINRCPLCEKLLTHKKWFSKDLYQCSTLWSNVSHIPPREKPHYEVEVSTPSSVQHIYIPPWSIDNIQRNHIVPGSPQSLEPSEITRLYKLYKKLDGTHAWKFIKTFPLIKVTDEKSLLDRINLLVCFL